MIPESESKPGFLESELDSESHDAGIGSKIRIIVFGIRWNRNQNRNHQYRNQNWNWNQGYRNHLQLWTDISMKIKQEEYVLCEIRSKPVLYYCSGTNQGNHMRNRSSHHYFL